MLERPKALSTNMVTKKGMEQWIITQGTFNMNTQMLDKKLRWLSGLIDSDGCFSLTKSVRKNNSIVYNPAVYITTKYEVLVDYLYKFFSDIGINHYIKGNNGCYNITIGRLSIINRFCDIMYPYIIVKEGELILLKSFCDSRLSHSNKRALYTNDENNIYISLKDLNFSHYGECSEYGILYEAVDKHFVEKMSLEWLSGYIDGDGEINIHKINRPNGAFQLRSTITIVTGSPLAKNLISSILDRYNIDYYLFKQLPGVKHKPNCRYKKFSFSIRKLKDCLNLCNLLDDRLVLKRHNCKVLKLFCESRISNNGKYSDFELMCYSNIKRLLNDYKQNN